MIRPFLAALAFVGATMLCAPVSAQHADAGPYVPTPQSIVDAMLLMGKVGPKDFVIDLGSGDGRIVRTAAARLGASGVGVDINEKLVKLANDEAAKEGVAQRARFVNQDLWTFDTSKATVVTVYLLPSIMPRLKQKLLAELKPGTRIVVHDYPLPDWKHEDYMALHEPLKRQAHGLDTAYLYLYVVPPR
ncbi:MAG: class I SAM-dependent methyltransferase [Burkholderiales bacterium]|nr:class I SAM-dependent methyltransferase [Burkholderiales bacterium]